MFIRKSKAFKPKTYSDPNIFVESVTNDFEKINLYITQSVNGCFLSLDNKELIFKTSCLESVDTNNIKSFCTSNKEMCKTVSEIQNTLKDVYRSEYNETNSIARSNFFNTINKMNMFGNTFSNSICIYTNFYFIKFHNKSLKRFLQH